MLIKINTNIKNKKIKRPIVNKEIPKQETKFKRILIGLEREYILTRKLYSLYSKETSDALFTQQFILLPFRMNDEYMDYVRYHNSQSYPTHERITWDELGMSKNHSGPITKCLHYYGQINYKLFSKGFVI